MAENRIDIEITAIKQKIVNFKKQFDAVCIENIQLKSEIEKLKVANTISQSNGKDKNQIVDSHKDSFTEESKKDVLQQHPKSVLDKEVLDQKISAVIDDIDQCLYMIHSRS